jgi:hypothetical protein
VDDASTPLSPPFAELAALLLKEPLAIARLLAQHVDDGTGHCRVCTAGGQTGRYRHPCALQLAAEEARRSDEVAQE